jgi:phosphotransferase system  glucose/maltose/N-acetylglucosamine-specific IIC component
MLIAIISLVVFAILLFLISFRIRKFDAEASYEELSTRQTVEYYKLNRRLKVLEEELMVEYKE